MTNLRETLARLDAEATQARDRGVMPDSSSAELKFRTTLVNAWRAKQLVVQEWQPIETAPKDGEPILLWKPNERMVGEYMLAGYWGEWPGQSECWLSCGGKPLGYYSEVANAPQGYPTHWLPLPEPPAVIKAMQG